MSSSRTLAFKRVAIAGAALLALGGIARAQVFEQVPNDSFAVLEVKNVQQLNQKIIKLAKEWGLDELQPDFKDPLAGLMKETHISKGVNNNGDLAIAMVNTGNGDEKEGLALIPVSDYAAFVGNFEAVGTADGGVQEVKNPQSGQKNMFVAQRGNYAAMCPVKAVLQKHDNVGLKLEGAIQREAQAKDVIAFINMPAIQKEVLPKMVAHRQEFVDGFSKAFADNPQLASFSAIAKNFGAQMFDAGEQFLKDSRGIAFSANIGQQGVMFSALGDFQPDSRWGGMVSKFKNTQEPLLAGLPDHKYFAFGGAAWDPALVDELSTNILDPLRDSLKGAPDAAKISQMIDLSKSLMKATNRVSVGYVVPEGGGFIQQVAIYSGDAAQMVQSQKKLMESYGDMMAAPGAGVSMKIKPGEDKDIDGVNFKTYDMTVEADQNNPQAMQARMIMQMFYGGTTIKMLTGQINPKTLLVLSGGSDDFAKQSVAAAKSGKDVLESSGIVAGVSRELPQQRFCEEYVSLDNIISSGVKMAQNFGLPIQAKVPTDLPPLGFTLGSDGASIRGDMYVPSQTVQSLIAAGIQAAQQMQKGNKGAL